MFIQRFEKLDEKPRFSFKDGAWGRDQAKEAYGDCGHCKYYDDLGAMGYCSYRYDLLFIGMVDNAILEEADHRYRQIRIRVPTWPYTHKACCCPAFESSWMETNGPRDVNYTHMHFAEDQSEDWTHMLGG